MLRKKVLAACFGVLVLSGCARVGLPPGSDLVKDDAPPRLKKAEAADANHVDVYFSEAMEEKTLTDTDNYEILGDNGALLEVADAVVTRPDAVSLVTRAQERGTTYTLTVRNVADTPGGNYIRGENYADFRGSDERDEKPPAVVASFPNGGEEKIGLYPEIVISFTDVMANTPATAELRDDLDDVIRVTGEFDGHFLRLRPGARLDYATRYTLRLSGAATDLAGNPLYHPQALTFRTIEDFEECIITGKAVVKEEGVTVAGTDIRVSLSANPLADNSYTAAYAAAAEDGAFTLTGVPPNSESKASFYLVATVDEDGDGVADLAGGYGYANGEAAALPPFLGGERLENVEVALERVDRNGPEVEKVVLSPNPTEGQNDLYIWASVVDKEGAAVTAAEVLFDAVWSDGTGIPLFPTEGNWGGGPVAQADRAVLDLEGEGVRGRGEHVAFVHARDALGNWGPVAKIAFALTAPPAQSRRVTGMVQFEKTPAAGALVSAARAGSPVPVAFAVSGDDGSFEITGLTPGSYDLSACYDEDEDGRWKAGEPAAAALEVDVTAGDAVIPPLAFTYPPSLTAANARYQRYGGADARGDLQIEVAVRDQDQDLTTVWAVLPDGAEAPLKDDGTPPDAAAGDGVFSWGETYRGELLTSFAFGDVVVNARDSRGNAAAAGADRYGGLRIASVAPPPAVTLSPGPEALTVRWESVEGATGGYVVLVIPADRWGRFTEPGTGDVYSNFSNPTFDTTLDIPWTAIKDWWAYPPGAEFVILVVASAGDNAAFPLSDKGISSATTKKPTSR